MSAVARQTEPQAEEAKSLTILEHLQELRQRLMICAGALVLAMIVSFYPITFWVIDWLMVPAERQIPGFELYFFKPLEGWTTTFRVSLLVGVALAMPVLVWQVLAFVGPGLTRSEKHWAYPIVLGASAMFIAGCAFAYYVEMPPALKFLLKPPRGEPLISISYYVDFATRLMVVTGLVFETPLLIMGLAKVGVVQSRTLWRWWRFALVGAFIISAVVTPSIDPITQSLVALPMIVLYFVGIGLARLVESAPIIPRA